MYNYRKTKRISTLLFSKYLISFGITRIFITLSIQLAENYVRAKDYTNNNVQVGSIILAFGYTERILNLDSIRNMPINKLNTKTRFDGNAFGQWIIGNRLLLESTRFRIMKVFEVW